MLRLLSIPALLLIAPLGFAQESPIKDRTDGRYEWRAKHDRDGIGKFYMGREIAYVMGHEAASWLERPEREEEENPKRLIELLKLKDGDIVIGISLLHQQGKIESAGAAADNDDFHAASLVRSMRDRSLRPMPPYKSSMRSNQAVTTSPSSSTFAGDTTRAHCRSPNKT